MPTGAPMPSCSSTTKVLRQHVQDFAPGRQRHGLGRVDGAPTSSRVISRFLPATAMTPRLLNP
jgi:hypothetical protein